MNHVARIALIVAATLASVAFAALAAWQFQRLGWKQDLIARVDQRLNAAPVAPPSATRVVSKADEYLRLRLRGQFEPREVLVQATTVLGGGHWVMAPMRLEDGSTVLVNRGFVSPERRAPELHASPVGPVQIIGLLRLSEPGGGPLRHNEPAQGRWYSRDVAGISAQLELTGPVASFFVDEAADADQPQRWPRPGLTVVNFANNHVVYAITWLALAAMSAAAVVYLVREERRRALP